VLTPVNHLTRRERKAKCRAAQDSLADRIAEYRPLAIITLLLSIKEIVEAAAIAAGSSAARYAVPFPGIGQQTPRMVGMIYSVIPSPAHLFGYAVKM
jgi:hypothetical protein